MACWSLHRLPFSGVISLFHSLPGILLQVHQFDLSQNAVVSGEMAISIFPPVPHLMFFRCQRGQSCSCRFHCWPCCLQKNPCSRTHLTQLLILFLGYFLGEKRHINPYSSVAVTNNPQPPHAPCAAGGAPPAAALFRQLQFSVYADLSQGFF